jgi:outer membrane receptor protein involved in Fe transport
MPRVHLAYSLAVTGLLAAAYDPSAALAQEKPSPDGRTTTLPPVKVSPQASPQKARRATPKKKASVQPAQRAETPTTNRSEGGDIDAAAASRALASPGRADLSPAASALPAASATLGARQLEQAPIASYGDIFRSLPGVNVANYGQGAIGYGIAMRGYTETEHGRDIAYFIDGVPVNEISSIHTPNYADLTVLIPETVKTIEVIRGPFSVEAGDSNLGGAVFITTKSSDPHAGLSFSGGSYGTGRGLATFGTNTGSYEPYLAFEGYTTDGYRDNSSIDRYNSFNKVTVPLSGGDTLTFRVQAYGATSGSPGYLKLSDLKSGIVSPTATVDSTDGSDKTMQNVVIEYASGPAEQQLTSMFYFLHDDFTRYADFCVAPEKPCQRVQHEERESVGGKVRKIWTTEIAGMPAQVLTGASWRTDVIDDFQAKTTARRVTGAVAADMSTTESNLAGFAQVQVKPASWLKFTAGGRFDQFFYDITNRLDPAKEPDSSPGIWSPKAGMAITPFPWLELYANYGQGFRSPDSVSELVPNYGQSIQPFKIESEEIGGKIQAGRLSFQAAVYNTDAENEAYVLPDGSSTLIGRTRRQGYELDARYAIFRERNSEIALFGNYAAVDAYRLDSANAVVPNVPDHTANLGIDFTIAMGGGERLFGQAYVTFIGKKFMTEDGLVTSSPYERVSAKIAYAWPSGWSAFTQATWYPGDRYSEAIFNFADDPLHAANADIYVAPVPEFTMLAGFSYRIPTSNPRIAESYKE